MDGWMDGLMCAHTHKYMCTHIYIYMYMFLECTQVDLDISFQLLCLSAWIERATQWLWALGFCRW